MTDTSKMPASLNEDVQFDASLEHFVDKLLSQQTLETIQQSGRNAETTELPRISTRAPGL